MRWFFLRLVCCALAAGNAAPARAADVIVLTVGAYKPVLLDLAQAFQAQSRDILQAANDTAGGIRARITRGEEADLVILPMAALTALAGEGKIVAGSAVPLAKVGIGGVVRPGAPLPDFGTVESFKQALLATPSIAYIDPSSGGSSGIYLASLFKRLGIAAAIARKAVLVPGGLAASRVDNGEAAMALQQISELKLVSGAVFVGPLPPEIQSYTDYGGAIPTAARRPAAGRALLGFLRGTEGMRALAARGLEAP